MRIMQIMSNSKFSYFLAHLTKFLSFSYRSDEEYVNLFESLLKINIQLCLLYEVFHKQI